MPGPFEPRFPGWYWARWRAVSADQPDLPAPQVIHVLPWDAFAGELPWVELAGDDGWYRPGEFEFLAGPLAPPPDEVR